MQQYTDRSATELRNQQFSWEENDGKTGPKKYSNKIGPIGGKERGTTHKNSKLRNYWFDCGLQ
eukprot:4440371-Amphidinium_carterae.1